MDYQTPTEYQKPKESLNKNVLIVCVSLIIVSVIISGTILYSKSITSTGGSGNNNGNGNPSNSVAPAAVDIKNVKIAGDPYIGNQNAPVVAAFWEDYQCPFCKRVEQEVISQLVKDYVNQGKLKIVFKDYAFLGPDSQTAALAGRAVWEISPDKFYQWREAMYAKQDNENGGWGTKADILALTQSLGIDSNKVGNLMVSKANEYQKEVDADKAEGTSFGINGTPGAIVGKQLIPGAQPYATFKAAVDTVLNGK